MRIIKKPEYEFQLCQRSNGKIFIKILTEINDTSDYVEVARINTSKNHWTDNGYGEMEEIHDELSKNAILTELLFNVNPLYPNPLFSRRKIEEENKRMKEALKFAVDYLQASDIGRVQMVVKRLREELR